MADMGAEQTQGEHTDRHPSLRQMLSDENLKKYKDVAEEGEYEQNFTSQTAVKNQPDRKAVIELGNNQDNLSGYNIREVRRGPLSAVMSSPSNSYLWGMSQTRILPTRKT